MSAASSESLAITIADAVVHPSRSKLERRKDAGRKPAEILAFTGVGPGFRIGEVCAGAGYFTLLFSLVVGATGRVFAHNTPGSVVRRKGNPTEKVVAKHGLENVTPIVAEMDAIDFPSGLDLVFSANTYHDAVWTGADRAQMNRRLYDSLKPGGHFVLIDHDSLPGVGTSHAKLYHRIERSAAIEEVTAAGFRLADESDVLQFTDDPLDVDVHQPAVHFKTRRFVLKFEK